MYERILKTHHHIFKKAKKEFPHTCIPLLLWPPALQSTLPSPPSSPRFEPATSRLWIGRSTTRPRLPSQRKGQKVAFMLGFYISDIHNLHLIFVIFTYQIWEWIAILSSNWYLIVAVNVTNIIWEHLKIATDTTTVQLRQTHIWKPERLWLKAVN